MNAYGISNLDLALATNMSTGFNPHKRPRCQDRPETLQLPTPDTSPASKRRRLSPLPNELSIPTRPRAQSVGRGHISRLPSKRHMLSGDPFVTSMVLPPAPFTIPFPSVALLATGLPSTEFAPHLPLLHSPQAAPMASLQAVPALGSSDFAFNASLSATGPMPNPDQNYTQNQRRQRSLPYRWPKSRGHRIPLWCAAHIEAMAPLLTQPSLPVLPTFDAFCTQLTGSTTGLGPPSPCVAQQPVYHAGGSMESAPPPVLFHPQPCHPPAHTAYELFLSHEAGRIRAFRFESSEVEQEGQAGSGMRERSPTPPPMSPTIPHSILAPM